MPEPGATKVCGFCKFEIPAAATVCGYCRKPQPLSSVAKSPEQLQKEAAVMRGCFITVAAFIGSAVILVLAFSVIPDAIKERKIRAKIAAEQAKQDKVEQQWSTEAAKVILPSISRYADIMDGKIATSPADRKRAATKIKDMAEVAWQQSGKILALGRGDVPNARMWRQLSTMLTTDAEVMESAFSKMKPSERASSAEMHRKLAAALKKQADEGFVHPASPESALYVPSATAGSSSSAPAPSGSHLDFIRESSDLPSSAQKALDKIYKVDPARARELNRQAHELGVQHLPNQ